MSNSYYKRLYLLQDKVLGLVKEQNTSFFLTGGTALSRFFLRHRYSDDLDLFTSFDPGFEKQVEKIKDCLILEFGDDFKTQIDQDYFKRFFISEPGSGIDLKLEFINDVPFHAGKLWGNEIYDKIDSWENILSNKISALSRNEERDLADLLFISYQFEFNWMEVIENAKKKDDWVEEIKVSKYLFDVETLSGIKFMDENLKPVDLIPDFKIMAKDLIKGTNNSLYGRRNKST